MPLRRLPKSSGADDSSNRFRSMNRRSRRELGDELAEQVGVTLLVLGIASFLAYQLKTLGPAGKVLVGS